jgi:Peptidase of plants and bacteria
VLVVLSLLAAGGVWAVLTLPGPAALSGTQRHIQVGDDRTLTLVSLNPPDTDAVLDAVSADFGAALSAVEAFWGTDWTPEITLVATGSAQQFTAQTGSDPRPDTAALAVADYVDPARREALGQRIVLAPGAAGMAPRARRIVLAHELFHYAARADTALDAPRWLTEGVADYVGRPADDEAAVARAVAPVTALPTDAEFTGTPEQLSAAYDRAWLFARYVADRYGAPALRALYQQMAGVDHADFETTVRLLFGAAPADLLADWQRWVVR